MCSVSSTLTQFDRVFDYSPGISTVNSLVNFVQKSALWCGVIEAKTSNHYYNHIEDKHWFRCFTLIFPGIGNLLVWFYDCYQFKQIAQMEADIPPGYQEAQELQQALKYDDALENYYAALSECNPLYKMRCYQGIGICRYNKQEYKKAAEAWIKSLETGSKLRFKTKEEHLFNMLPDCLLSIQKIAQSEQKILKAKLQALCNQLWQDPQSRVNCDAAHNAVLTNWCVIDYLDPRLKNNEQIAWALARQNIWALSKMGQTLRQNQTFMLGLIDRYPGAVQAVDKFLWKQPEFALIMLKKGRYTGYVSKTLWKNPKFVESAVELEGTLIQYATFAVQRQHHIAIAAVKQNANAYGLLPNGLRETDTILLAALPKAHFDLIRSGLTLFKDDKDFMLKAAAINGEVLREIAGDGPRTNRDVLLAAIRTYPDAFKIAPHNLKEDETFFHAAVRQNSRVLLLAPKKFTPSKEDIIKAWNQRSERNVEVEEVMLKTYPYLIAHVHATIRNSWNFTELAIGRNWRVYRFLTKEEQAKRVYAKSALRNAAIIYKDVPDSLKQDDSILWESLSANSYLWKYFGDTVKTNVKSALRAVKLNYHVYDRLSTTLRQNPKIILARLKKSQESMPIPDSLLKDKTFLLKAVKFLPDLAKHASTNFENDTAFLIKLVKANKDTFNHLSADHQAIADIQTAAGIQEEAKS